MAVVVPSMSSGTAVIGGSRAVVGGTLRPPLATASPEPPSAPADGGQVAGRQVDAEAVVVGGAAQGRAAATRIDALGLRSLDLQHAAGAQAVLLAQQHLAPPARRAADPPGDHIAHQ